MNLTPHHKAYIILNSQIFLMLVNYRNTLAQDPNAFSLETKRMFLNLEEAWNKCDELVNGPREKSLGQMLDNDFSEFDSIVGPV